MSIKQELHALVQLVRSLGGDPAIVQGGGGNFSLKDSEEGHMYVKASGIRFDTTKETDLVTIDLLRFRACLEQEMQTSRTQEEHEEAMNRHLFSCRLSDGRPSMETSMHCFLPRVALHIHAVSSNVMLCMEEGEKVIRNLFTDVRSVWIPYVSPGYALGASIMKRGSNGIDIAFLQNHGIIVCGETVVRVKELVTLVLERCTRYLKERIPSFVTFDRTWLSTDYKPQSVEKFLFPDVVVYARKSDSEAAYETLGAQQYVEEAIRALDAMPRYLFDDDVAYLREMEAEKYRQQQI